jgi:hypothetical protein
MLFSGGDDGILCYFEFPSGKIIRTTYGYGPIRLIMFSGLKANELFYKNANSDTLYLWDFTRDDKFLHPIPANTNSNTTIFSRYSNKIQPK